VKSFGQEAQTEQLKTLQNNSCYLL
jgi:hypothetical protein